MQIITDQVYEFSKDNKPCATAKPGEVLQFNTQDCFSNRIPDENTTMADLDYTYGFANPAAGPVYIEGAEPGDVLVVDIYEVKVADEGTIATDDHCGPLFETTGYRTKKIPIKDGMATFNQVSFPINPMIGVIGTAPSGPDVIDGFVGSHGGNMDNTAITTGATLYFPVAVEGALFGCGDMHAAMGDGEVSVSGAEVAGYATVTLTAMPELKLVNPLIENDTHFGIIVSAESLDAAAELAVQQMVDLLASRTNESEADLVMLLSLVADVQVCQMVDPQKTVRFMVPKYVLDAIGFAL